MGSDRFNRSLQQWGVDETGADRIYGDTGAGQFQRQCACQSDNAMLCRNIPSHVGVALEPGGRRHNDKTPVARSFHARDRRLPDIEDTCHIDRHQVRKILRCRPLEGGRMRCTRIGNDPGDRAALFHGRVKGRPDRFGVGYVAHEIRQPLRRQRRFAPPHDGNLRAGRGHFAGDPSANA